MAGGTRVEQAAAEANVYNSPGWRRLQARAGSHGLSQPRESTAPAVNAQAIAAFAPDDRVFHQKFGYGTVLSVEGDKLEIAFDKAGVKHIVARFVTDATQSDDLPF
jgi:DNA helicase-2/ATP-dependent DNA helicase PcrA